MTAETVFRIAFLVLLAALLAMRMAGAMSRGLQAVIGAFRKLAQQVAGACRQDHAHALRSQLQRDGPANSSAGAGHDGSSEGMFAPLLQARPKAQYVTFLESQGGHYLDEFWLTHGQCAGFVRTNHRGATQRFNGR